MNRRTKWYLQQAVAFALLAFALFQDSQVSLNLLRGVTWMMFICHGMVLFVPTILAKLRHDGHPVTEQECNFVDIFFLLGLFAGGWFITAFAYGLSCVFERAIWFGKQTTSPTPE